MRVVSDDKSSSSSAKRTGHNSNHAQNPVATTSLAIHPNTNPTHHLALKTQDEITVDPITMMGGVFSRVECGEGDVAELTSSLLEATSKFRQILLAVQSTVDADGSTRFKDEQTPPLFRFSDTGDMSIKKQRCAKILKKGLQSFGSSIACVLGRHLAKASSGNTNHQAQVTTAVEHGIPHSVQRAAAKCNGVANDRQVLMPGGVSLMVGRSFSSTDPTSDNVLAICSGGNGSKINGRKNMLSKVSNRLLIDNQASNPETVNRSRSSNVVDVEACDGNVHGIEEGVNSDKNTMDKEFTKRSVACVASGSKGDAKMSSNGNSRIRMAKDVTFDKTTTDRRIDRDMKSKNVQRVGIKHATAQPIGPNVLDWSRKNAGLYGKAMDTGSDMSEVIEYVGETVTGNFPEESTTVNDSDMCIIENGSVENGGVCINESDADVEGHLTSNQPLIQSPTQDDACDDMVYRESNVSLIDIDNFSRDTISSTCMASSIQDAECNRKIAKTRKALPDVSADVAFEEEDPVSNDVCQSDSEELLPQTQTVNKSLLNSDKDKINFADKNDLCGLKAAMENTHDESVLLLNDAHLPKCSLDHTEQTVDSGLPVGEEVQVVACAEQSELHMTAVSSVQVADIHSSEDNQCEKGENLVAKFELLQELIDNFGQCVDSDDRDGVQGIMNFGDKDEQCREDPSDCLLTSADLLSIPLSTAVCSPGTVECGNNVDFSDTPYHEDDGNGIAIDAREEKTVFSAGDVFVDDNADGKEDIEHNDDYCSRKRHQSLDGESDKESEPEEKRLRMFGAFCDKSVKLGIDTNSQIDGDLSSPNRIGLGGVESDNSDVYSSDLVLSSGDDEQPKKRQKTSKFTCVVYFFFSTFLCIYIYCNCGIYIYI